MAEADWMAYTGAITGIIGAATGIAGGVMGWISYRRSEALKSLDLRVELRKAENDLRSTLEDLPRFIEHALRSRSAVSAAKGTRKSGAMTKWEDEVADDLASAHGMQKALPPADTDLQGISQIELERRFGETHASAGAAQRLRNKYLEWGARDDKDRDFLQQIRHAPK